MLIQHRSLESKGAFFLEADGETVAELDYNLRAEDQMIIEHTEVDKQLRGQDIGYQLVEAAVEYARSKHYKILPVCPFAAAVFQKKPELQDVLAS